MKNIVPHELFTVLVIFSISATAACLKEGDRVSFSGVLKKEMFYGPPGWGENPETDEKVYDWFLYPDKPLTCVTGAETRDSPNWNKSMQIDLIDSDKIDSRYLNHHVTIDGRIELAATANDNSPVLLTDISGIHDN